MRIANFTNTYPPLVGGIERSVQTFCEDLRAMGHQTLVVTPAVQGAEESDDLVYRAPAIKAVAGTDFSLKLPQGPALRRRLNAFQPELVHSHHPFLLGDTALRVARARGIPLIFTHHTFYERYADFFGFESEATARLAKSLPAEYANLCDLVIAPTESIAGILRQRGAVRPIRVLPTGTDTHLFSSGDGDRFRALLGIPRDVQVVGHVGRLIPAKNMVFLGKALAALLQRAPELRVLLVGHGESEPGLRERFRGAGVQDRVVFAGHRSGRELADAYAAIDAFVFASRTDTQGLVLVESLCAGAPVVALDAPGPRDIVRHDREGLLLPMEAAPEELAEALRELMADPQRLRRLAGNAPARAAEFDRRVCAERLAGLYAELLQRGRQAPEDLDPWDQWLSRVGTEWSLLREKASAAAAAFLGPGPD